MAKNKVRRLTVPDLMERFCVKKVDTIYTWAKRYNDVLQPMKIGGKLLFDPVNVAKFEEHMKIKS